ncbi:NADP-dependent alcohol dehydrogenase [Ceratobasidium sp. 370]|nr:NADP-dependent alcohol dehydrogenase [Ceratobasidium sp. 370]
MSSKAIPFKGYAIHDTKEWSQFAVVDIQPKQWEEEDIDIAITHCGVCGSDLHILTGGWQNVKQLPLVAGHEIVGYAVRVGSIAAEKAGIKVGDRVGVGAQIGSCGDCRACELLRGNYCAKKIETYNDYYPDGTLSQGGYSTAIRANHRFVVPIPEGIKSEHAASMMCAGLTMYSPLTRQNVGPGSKVGIVGLGGLGHYGVLFAKALGAEVYAFSPDASKEEDMKRLGADNYVITTEENLAPLERTLDIILSTVDLVEGFQLRSYLK